MPRRMLRLTALAILFIAAVLTPRQGGAAGGGPLPAGTANPVRPEQPPTAVGWQAPRRLRSVGGGAVLPAQRGTVRRAGALPARAALAHAGHGAVAAGMARDVAQAYGNLPLAFERNEGQTDPSVSYLAHSQGYTAFLTQEGITLALAPVTGTTTLPEKPGLFTARPALAATPVPGPVVSMRLDGASGQTQAQAANPLPGVVNYFIGNNPSTWHTNIPTYGQVTYPDVYPGVDLVYHGQGPDLAFDFTVHPGAQVSAIRLQLAGVSGAAPNSAGDLVIGAGGATLRALQPTAYQDIAGQRRAVGAHYHLLGGNAVGLSLDSYDATQPVTIDPVLVYSSYLGGSGYDEATGIAVDDSGDVYLTGYTDSSNFPTANPLQLYNGDTFDAFVTEIAAGGTGLIYSTYLGGTTDFAGSTEGSSIAVDGAGNAYVTGGTSSSSFPTVNALQPSFGGNYDAYVSEIAAGGATLVYSTFLGGSGIDGGSSIALDSAGNVYVAGSTSSANFPTVSAFQPTYPGTGGPTGFVSEIGASRTSFIYSTYLGGSVGESATGIAVDSAGEAYVTGWTESPNFPIVNALQSKFGSGSYHAFVSKFSATGTSLVYSTFLGGSGNDQAADIALDSANNVYVVGITSSTNFPLVAPLQPGYGGGADDAFVSKLNAAGSALTYSTYLGGSGDDWGYDIAVDATGAPAVTGYTSSPDFRAVNAVQSTPGGGEDAFVSTINPTGSALASSTYLGGSGDDVAYGIARDGNGNVYVAGDTLSTNFPTAHAFQPAPAGAGDAFVAKLGPPSCTTGTAPASSGAVPWHPHYTARITSMMGVSVDLADGHADLSASDMQIAGRGPDLVVRHTWDSTLALGCTASSNGSGWRSDLTRSMSGAPGSTVTYVDATGARWVFPYVGGAYQTPAGLPYSLTANGSGYTLLNILTGESLGFDNQGRYTSDTDVYGNANILTQGGSGAPTREANSGGRALVMTYANGLLNDIQSPIYHGSGPTAPDGQHVAHGYDGPELTAIAWGVDSVDPQTHATDQQAAYFGYTGDLLTSVTTPMTLSGTLAVTRVWTLGYDASDRLVSITSPISGSVGQAGYEPASTTLITYYSGSTVVRAGYGSGHVINTTYTLDAAGRATAVMDGLSHFNHYTYDADNDVTSSKDGNNNVTNYYYQYVGPLGTGGIASTGQVTETVYPAIHPTYPANTLTSPTAHYVYNATSHDLTEAYDTFGAYTWYTYNQHNNASAHDLASEAQLTGSTTVGSTTYYHWRGQIRQYDPYGELTGQIDGRGVSVPDTTSLATQPVASANGAAASYTHSATYNGSGDQTSSSTPAITTNLNGSIKTAPAITQYTYDGDGNQVTMQSANNYVAGHPTANATQYGYDHLGRLNSTSTPPMPTLAAPGGPPNLTGSAHTSIAFDGDGNPAQTMDGNEAATNTSYDPLGRLVSQDQPLSLITDTGMVTATTIMTYTATNLAAMRDPQGNVTTYTYDAANRLTSLVDAANEHRNYYYDPANNVTSIALGDGTTTETTVSRGYDALNQVATETVSGKNLSPSLTTTYSYDLHGNLVRQLDPNNDTTFIGYDLVDQPTSKELDPGAPNTPTGAHRETFAYDAAGNPVGCVDFRGGAIAVTVDGDDRQTQQVATYTGTPSITTTAQYDPDGNLVSQSEVTNGQTHTYSTSLNPADWTSGSTNDGLSTSLIGDGGGAPQQQTIQNGGGTVAWNTDNAERALGLGVTSIGSTTPLTSTFAYNANSLTTQIALPNSIQENVQYDGASRLTSLTAQNTSNLSLLNDSFGYGYDHVGWTTSINTTLTGGANSSLTLAHDALGRLVSQSGTTTGSWVYDGRNNLKSSTVNGLTTSYSYSPSNPEEVTSTTTSGQAAVSYSYDAAGNPTSISNGGSINSQLTYDALGRLYTVTLANGTVIAMSYNALGQRASYTVTPQGAGQPSLSETFKYQSDQLSQVSTSGTGVPTPYTDTYVYEQTGAPIELLRQVGSTTTPYWYVLDGQGNVVALTTQSGTVVDSYQYDQWGKPTSVSESVPQQLRYAGYWYDQELGWYWTTVREYDPTLERFLQPDPSEQEGLFSYAYAGDNPTDNADPSGLDTQPQKSCWLSTKTGQFDCDEAAHSGQWVEDNNAILVTGPEAACPFHPNIAWHIAWSSFNLCDWYANNQGWITQFGEYFQRLGHLVFLAGCTITNICADFTVLSSNAAWYYKLLAAADIASWLPGLEELKGAEYAARLAELGLDATKLKEIRTAASDILGCALCFPATTLVATPSGERPLKSLKAGDLVLSEDPKTARIEAEPVLAVRHDPVSPLMEVDLADGSSIRATADHPFWVDWGVDFRRPGWLAADQLRLGDQLRRAGGMDVTVVGLRYRVGAADVYTLTVAHDHTFFVSSAQVLVHNAYDCQGLSAAAAQAAVYTGTGVQHGFKNIKNEFGLVWNPVVGAALNATVEDVLVAPESVVRGWVQSRGQQAVDIYIKTVALGGTSRTMAVFVDPMSGRVVTEIVPKPQQLMNYLAHS